AVSLKQTVVPTDAVFSTGFVVQGYRNTQPATSRNHLTHYPYQAITKCGCADGLECRVTKEFKILGQVITLRQCMKVGVPSVVEKLEDEEVKQIMEKTRTKRFLIDVRTCATEAECGSNRCCLFNKICSKKIPKEMTCFL
ncbi:hypothetical protein QZH41_017235, partial [Actinostola sp. cb2023]